MNGGIMEVEMEKEFHKWYKDKRYIDEIEDIIIKEMFELFKYAYELGYDDGAYTGGL